MNQKPWLSWPYSFTFGRTGSELSNLYVRLEMVRLKLHPRLQPEVSPAQSVACLTPQGHLASKKRQPESQQAAICARTQAKQLSFVVAGATTSGEPCTSAVEQQSVGAPAGLLRPVCPDGPVGSHQNDCIAGTAVEQQQSQGQQQQEHEQRGVCQWYPMRASNAEVPDDAAGELSSVSCFAFYEPDRGSFAFPTPSVSSPAPASPGFSHRGKDQTVSPHLVLPASTTSARHTTSALARQQQQHQQSHLSIPTTPACSLHDGAKAGGVVEQTAAATAEEVALVATPPEETAPLTSPPGVTAPVASPVEAASQPQAHRRAATGCDEAAVVRVHSTPFSVRSAAEAPKTNFINQGLIIHNLPFLTCPTVCRHQIRCGWLRDCSAKLIG